jgi:hypothetical protein
MNGKEIVVECKFDGDRIQVHKNGNRLNFWSRQVFMSWIDMVVCGLCSPLLRSSEPSDHLPSLGARTFNDHPEFMDAIGDVLCQHIIPEK